MFLAQTIFNDSIPMAFEVDLSSLQLRSTEDVKKLLTKQNLQAMSQIIDVLKNYYTSPTIDLDNQKWFQTAKMQRNKILGGGI
jgi:elongation factor P hydroxylase